MSSLKRPFIDIAANVNTKLGAGEFATILNGDDARQILAALKSFTTTVKRERRQALEVKKDDDDDSDDEEEDNESEEEEGEEEMANGDPSSNKKLKEDWMEDSKDYNVPFVGTSVAKGETGQVNVGSWPTGFLEAYLTQSPMAVELTSTDLVPPLGHVHKKLLRQKQGKLSYAIFRAYLAALSELLTAAMPMVALKREYGLEINKEDANVTITSREQPKFMTTLIKDRFPAMMQLLNDETGSGKGKAGSISGIGQLAAPVLQIVTRLAASSLGASRQVARSLDASLREGVLKILLREPRKPKEKAATGKPSSEKEPEFDRLAVPYKTRASCLDLATALLDVQDPSVTSYISTFGNKERKNNPGLLYLAVRYGFQDSMFQQTGSEKDEAITEAQEGYLESISDLLESIAVLLDEEKGKGTSLSRRALADLLGAEALQNVSQAATCAPALRSFEAVLRSKDDDYDEVTPIEDVGIDARRILFSLLSSSSKSPFLWRISGKDDDKLSVLYTTFIVKSLNQLLNTSVSIPTQTFIIHALTENTTLLPGFFKGVKIPDANKATFRFLAKLRFIGRIMKEGPVPSICMVVTATMDSSPRGVEKVMLSLLPQNLNKHFLSKAIQSSNPLVVAEATKFAILALVRFKSFLPSLERASDEVRDSISRAFITRLPDIQAIVSTRSKFDPFLKVDKKENVIINGLICRLLNTFVEVLPSAILSAKFDWTKLLPDNPANFTKAKPIAQVQILQTLDIIMRCKSSNGTTDQQHAAKPTAKACRALIEVAINASHVQAYVAARSIVKEMVLRLIECPMEPTEITYCLNYEISLWIDGLQVELLSEFQSLLEEALKNTFRHKLHRIQSCKNAGLQRAVPEFSFSLLLSIGLSRLETGSDDFVNLICQITSRCLLFHSNPVPLAGLVNETFSKNRDKRGGSNLQAYAVSLLAISRVDFDSKQALEVSQTGTKLMESLLGPFLKDEACGKSSHSNAGVTTRERTLYLRFCLQSIAIIAGFPEHKTQNEVFFGRLRGTIRRLVRSGAIEPLLKVVTHPAISDGNLLRGNIGFLELFALTKPGPQHGINLDLVTSGLISRLDECTGIATLDLYDLLKSWFYNQFVKVPRYDDIGDTLVHLATEASEQRSQEIRNVERAVALNWISGRHAPFSVETAWTAWESETLRLLSTGQCDYSIVQAAETALCGVGKEEESLLFVKMRELGNHECLRRCLLSQCLKKKIGGAGGNTSSLIAKAIEVGCQDIEQVLLFLTACLDSETSTVHSFLKYYDISPSEFKSLWVSGFLDGALIASTKSRDDEFIRRSLVETVHETQNRESAPRLLRAISSDAGSDLAGISSGYAGRLLSHLVEFTDSLDHSDDYHVAVLEVLFDCLPKALKKASRAEEDDCTSASFCLDLLDRALNTIKSLNTTGAEISSVHIDLVVKSSLKIGISDSQGNLALLKASCLKLIRSLICLKYQSETISDWGDLCAFLNPTIIWAMTLSHSSFKEAIIPTEGLDGKEWKAAREELINLLVCCSSLSTDKLSIEQDVLSPLLGAYNGGTSKTDIALRRLFHLVAPCFVEDEMPFADDLCSRALSSSSEQDSKEEAGWRFLGDVLELRRVRETISQFPRFQYVSPKPLIFETWIEVASADDNDTIMEIEEKKIAKADESDMDSSDESSDSSSDDESAHGGNDRTRNHIISSPEDDTWKGRGADFRYDPSFVVPQIVTALESLFVKEINDTATEHSEVFARFAQHIIENGGMSLCLASLCSYCPLLRRHAFAGLCLLLQAIDSEAAKDSKTWRERPQLKMILNAVQRGFVLRKAMLASKGLSALIPKVSPLSAIFLAKASLILSKPGDVMFGALNRYFLKLDRSHGAYDDMTRLPAFIPLFCSSAEEHSERERQWALQCLRDSFLEGYSIVASCHAPQLLLTTLGRTHLDEAERQLVIQVLTRLLQFGERAAAHDLLERVGLLSWLRTFLVSQPLEDTSDVLTLLEVTIQRAMTYTEKENYDHLILDLRNLLATVAETKGGARLLCLLVDNLSTLGYQKSVSPAGVPLSTALRLLQSSDNDKHKTRMLEAVCTAPVVIDGASVPAYCTTILKHMLELPNTNTALVLQRVCDLAQLSSDDDWTSETLQLVLTAHSRAVRSDSYRLCLEALLDRLEATSDEGKSISVARRVIAFLQEDAKQPKK